MVGKIIIKLPNIILTVVVLITPCIVSAAVFKVPSGDVAELIEAINKANANGQNDTIVLKPGIYTLTTADNNIDGANGLPSITSKITIKGAGADKTVIERQFGFDPPHFRIFHVDSTGNLRLDGLTISGGGGSAPIFFGGGILNRGVLTIANSVISNNISFFVGGAIYSNGTLEIVKSSIQDNFADRTGGIENDGDLTISHSIIRDNAAPCGTGGGISNFDGTMDIINSSIDNNFAAFGGGIRNDGIATITNSTINENTGIDACSVGCAGEGGGIVNFFGGILTITNSTIADNFATDGGAIFTQRGTTKIINTTIADNLVEVVAAGILAFDSDLELQNSILAHNISLDHSSRECVGDDIPFPSDCFGTITSLGNNIVGDTTDCNVTLQLTDLTGDPGLGNFTDDGRPGNGHFPLLPTSQAIDAGDNDACLENSRLKTDQIGNPRVGICDIGAIEFQPFKNKGQCISTLIKQNCSGLKGKDRAACNHQQQQFCKNLF